VDCVDCHGGEKLDDGAERVSSTIHVLISIFGEKR
jgi:hypothetical protein